MQAVFSLYFIFQITKLRGNVPLNNLKPATNIIPLRICAASVIKAASPSYVIQ
jgi:hypothetical protein